MNSLPHRFLALLFTVAAFAAALPAQDKSGAGRQVDTKIERTQIEIVKLLNDFMEHVDEATMHDRFWAEDLVYTGSAGNVQSKADIMKSFAEKAKKPANKTAEQPEGKPETYAALDPVVRIYGEAAALTFKLVRHASDGKTVYYRNSGLLLHRDGKWQVVMWQATKLPDEPAK